MATTELSVSLVQTDLIWENPEANRKKIEAQLEASPGDTDLIILAEMFPTGFSMEAEKLAEPKNGESFQWMKKMAQKHSAAVTGSVISEENGKHYNRLYFVYPDGSHELYDKKHLFTFAGEHHHYSAGEKRLIVEYKGWKICPMICYDLRFPVWSRNTEAYDLLLYIANWPAKRSSSWDALLKARSIENLAYVAGVNRVGTDGKDLNYNGHSAVYDMLGNPVSKNYSETEFVEHVKLNKNELDEARHQFAFLNDRDAFQLIE